MKKYRAYSLIELSIVLFIMAILLTSGGLLFSNISRNQNIKEAQIVTLERTDKIYKAISNYLAENHRLPCPAKLTTKSNDNNYGSESRSGKDCLPTDLTGSQDTNNLGIDQNMNLIYGMVPIDVLNLNKQDAEDGYGRKFGYAIIKEFGTKTGTNLGFESYSGSQRLGEREAGVVDFEYIKIMDNSTGTEAVITNKAIMLLISHGENGTGAYNPDTGSQIFTNNSTNNEKDNVFTRIENGNIILYNRRFFIDSNETNSITSQIGVFDDLVIFKTKDQLVRDAGLEFIECSADEGFIYQAYDNACFNTNGTISPKSYGKTANITATISALGCGCTTSEAILQRTCGKYGKWSDIFCNENYKLYNLDEVRADSVDGLKLYDDDQNGIFIEDGGNVTVSATNSGHVVTSIYNPSSGYSSLYLGSGGVSMQHYVGAGDAVVATNTNHDLQLIADRFAGDYSKITIRSANGGVDIDGDLRVNGSVTSVTSTSDKKYKNNIKSLKNILPKIMELNAVYYDWKLEEFPDKNFSKKRQIGFIAQEIEGLFPELVNSDNSNNKSIAYSKITAILVRAIQELQEEQSAKIQEIKKSYDRKIKKLIKRIEKLEDAK
jgi:prepilin-type N-terminal cleavage/methylation domain-containing protein